MDGPGARLQTAGVLLLALAVPAIFISYIVVLSPIAPARYYRRLEGIEDFGAGLAAWLGALIAALVLTGLALYFAGTRKERRARR